MTDDRFLELAPLAALGALDGDDRAGFEAHLAACGACREELAVHESVAARLALSLPPVRPSRGTRDLVLQSVGARPEAQAGPKAAPRPAGWALSGLAAAAAVALGVAFLVARNERDAARLEAAEARQQGTLLQAELQSLQQELAAARVSLAQERAFRELVAHPDSRLARLAGLPPAPRANARIVWNATSREAVLLASGLEPAPAGKAYEVWVIGKGAPAPAGLFHVDERGKAVFRLPDVAETAEARTFAITVEPAEGTAAPTGPMVLAGAAS